MELKLTKTMSCRIAAQGRWGNAAAAFMGLSFFLRMVYYFGLRNLRDIGVFEVIFAVVLPLVISVAFILALKLPKLNQSRYLGILAAAAAVNYLFIATPSFAGILCDVLVLGLGVLVLGACEGFVPQRKWLLWADQGTLVFRVLFVDLFGFILPLGELNLLGYIPQCSNLFTVVALCMLTHALRLRKNG